MRYHKKREYLWSASIAYSVGLIASDGCLQKDGRHIDLTSVDVEQLTNFCTAIGRSIPIGIKQNKSKKPAFRIQFSDVAYYDFLIQAGITPNKSKTINRLVVPDEFYPDFLRGVFDGDGTTYAYMDTRWKSSYMFYTGFTSASLSFIEYLHTTNSRLIGTLGSSIRRGSGAYSLVYAKTDSQFIYEYMYYSDNVLSLARKRRKLEDFIQLNKGGILVEH